MYEQEELLVVFLTSWYELVSTYEPNSKIIIAGDMNQFKDLLVHSLLPQMVKKPIRENSILNVFMTNTPYLEKKTKVIKSTVRSDHNMVIVIPRTPVKAKRTAVYFSGVREHNKVHMANLLKDYDLQVIFALEDCELKCDNL